MTPRRLGPYLVDRELGRGGMGSVFLGRHAALGRLAALKVLPRPYSFVPDNCERFRREAQAMARVVHTNVLQIYEVGDQDGIPFAALEFVEGGTLEDILRSIRGLDFETARKKGEERLPGRGAYETRVAWVLAEVAAALSAVHQTGIVHRDVKPSNILLNGREGVFLGDFGLALQSDLGTLTLSGEIVGTRHYLAPELTFPGGVATPASDVYSLGVTLYELLTLRAPFSGDSESVLFRSIREREPQRPRGMNRRVSPEMEAVVLHALEKAPSRRYASAAAMETDLRSLVAGRPVSASRRSPVRRLTRNAWFNRHRIAGVSLSVALAILTAFAASWWWTRQREARDRDFAQRFEQAKMLVLRSERAAEDKEHAEELLAGLLWDQPAALDPWTWRIVNRIVPIGGGRMARKAPVSGDVTAARRLLQEAPQALAQEAAGELLSAALQDVPPGAVPELFTLPANEHEAKRAALVLYRVWGDMERPLTLLRPIVAANPLDLEAHQMISNLLKKNASLEGYRSAAIARALQPEVGGSYITLAMITLRLAQEVGRSSGGIRPNEEMLRESIAYARHALELDPDSSGLQAMCAY